MSNDDDALLEALHSYQDVHIKAANRIRQLRAQVEDLTQVLCWVSDELNDPICQYWCDDPERDRALLENLRDYVWKAVKRHVPVMVNALEEEDDGDSYMSHCIHCGADLDKQIELEKQLEEARKEVDRWHRAYEDVRADLDHQIAETARAWRAWRDYNYEITR